MRNYPFQRLPKVGPNIVFLSVSDKYLINISIYWTYTTVQLVIYCIRDLTHCFVKS